MRAKLLVGELDLNGLIGAFELYSLRHRLVSRACAPRLFVFIHKNNQLTDGGASPTALLRLRSGGEGRNRTDASMAPLSGRCSPRRLVGRLSTRHLKSRLLHHHSVPSA